MPYLSVETQDNLSELKQIAADNHEIWQGSVFVNIDSTAEPLAENQAPMEELIKEYDLASWITVNTVD